ncbi:MAG: ATP-binding protein [Bilifractor sp.]
MPLTNSQYEAIMRIYTQKQLKNQRELDRRKKEIYTRIPRIPEIDAEVASVSVKKAFYLLGDPAGADIDTDAAIRDLAEERRALLLSHGYPEDYLELHYDCPICHDTGYVHDRKCTCFRQMEIELLYSASNLKDALKTDTFDSFSLDYYPKDSFSTVNRKSYYWEAQRALEQSKAFVRDFGKNQRASSPENLLFYGDVGVGKTHLSHAIAKGVLDLGYSVFYLTAYDLFELMGRFKFHSDEDARESYDTIYVCDLLIIDDLGTEMLNNFVTSELFLIVNERILRKKSTIISTNLSLKKVREAFSERTFSRIMGAYQLIHISGADIRIQKKLGSGRSIAQAADTLGQ